MWTVCGVQWYYTSAEEQARVEVVVVWDTRVCITAQAWIGARSLLSRTFGQLCGTALLLLAAALLQTLTIMPDVA